MGEIRVAVAGAGNLCSSTVQGMHYYAKAKEPIGLLHPTLGGYKPSDIKFVAAFDISRGEGGQGPLRGHIRQAEQCPAR